jgi:hypothetical protein
MKVMVISAKEFEQNLETYFDKIDRGVKISIKRGKDKIYKLTASKKDDSLMTKEEFDAMIDERLKDYEEGRYTTIHTKEELHAFLDSL